MRTVSCGALHTSGWPFLALATPELASQPCCNPWKDHFLCSESWGKARALSSLSLSLCLFLSMSLSRVLSRARLRDMHDTVAIACTPKQGCDYHCDRHANITQGTSMTTAVRTTVCSTSSCRLLVGVRVATGSAELRTQPCACQFGNLATQSASTPHALSEAKGKLPCGLGQPATPPSVLTRG